MPSSLFATFGNQQSPQQNQGNGQSIIQQFQKFKESFSGDPKQKVQEILNSGKISQAQYNRAVQMANQFQQILSKFR